MTLRGELPVLRGPRAAVRAEGGGLQGQVSDLLSGQPIVGALVSAGGVQANTDEQGRYSLQVKPGTYEVSAQAAGYIGMSKSRQTVKADAATQVDLAMVLDAPSPEQQETLDAIFRQQAGAGTSAEELEAWRAGLSAAELTRLPSTIRVLMPDGIVVAMPLDEYVKGVVPYEMAPYWPMQALEAQAVAARCYAATAHRHADQGADVCTTVHCQVWRPTHYETTDRAVDATHNVAAMYGGSIIHAYFFAHCDGHTKNSEDVWGGAVGYLRSVACPCGFTSCYGHGVGMCQEGARALANSGSDYRQILTHYYTGIQIAAPALNTLGGGRVRPSDGDTSTLFTFEVLYTGSDMPVATNLYIDGYSYNLEPVPGLTEGGTLYRYQTLLQAGEHVYGFHFEDGYNPPVNLPATGSFNGPTVRVRGTALPTPTPAPTPPGTLASQWSQTTQQDFRDGSFFQTICTREDNGEIALQTGRTSGVYTSTVKLSPVNFVAVGSKWQASVPAGSVLTIEVRSSLDANTWSNWVALQLMDAQREEARVSYGELVYLSGPFLQYRLGLATRQPGSSPVLRALSLIFIDSQRGPSAAQALSASTAAPGGPTIISRAGWGCNESLMTWPPEYRPIRKVVVHHTATPNGQLDSAATVRAIYYYHAVTRGWGDIGYNYLIDTQGHIYEGRSGGEGVVGGHAKQYAWGSIGVSLIGDYEQVDVPDAMQRALVELLAWKGNLHFVNPVEHGFYIDKDLPNIMGHRDGAQTECPGKYAYARLPEIRQAVLARMAELPPNVRLDAPVEGAPVSGVLDVAATGSPVVSQVQFFVDDVLRSTDSAAPFTWKWNTTALGDGQHRLKARARTPGGLQADTTVTVTVDNTPPSGSLSGPSMSNVPAVTLYTRAEGAQTMQFSNGWRWDGEDLRHQSGRPKADPDAANGLAWLGLAASDAAGWWYGPYFMDLPTGYAYRVYYRLKAADNSTSAELAKLDVSDDYGVYTYVGKTLTGQDFAAPLRYQEAYLDFDYYRRDEHGLEFRTYFTARSDLYLDRVHLFRSPRVYASSIQWTLPAPDGLKEVDVRYLDSAGNVSPIYSVNVLLDTAPPQWLDWNGSRAQVHDVTSGLHGGSAEFSISTDGGATWGSWQPATCNAPEGTLDTVSVSAAVDPQANVRFRISDRTGNRGESPVYGLATPTPAPTHTPGPSPTVTGTPTRTPIASPTATASATPEATATPTASPTATQTSVPTSTPTVEATATPTASPTATELPGATPTPTSGPVAGIGSLSGRVLMQGRYTYAGATVSAGGGLFVLTASDGSYTLTDVPAGPVALTVRMPGYLEAARQDVVVVAGTQTTLSEVTLRGGDANGDCMVNLSDLVIVSSNFGGSPPRDARSDINQDGRVDLQDLLLVTINLGQHCPGLWRP